MVLLLLLLLLMVLFVYFRAVTDLRESNNNNTHCTFKYWLPLSNTRKKKMYRSFVLATTFHGHQPNVALWNVFYNTPTKNFFHFSSKVGHSKIIDDGVQK